MARVGRPPTVIEVKRALGNPGHRPLPDAGSTFPLEGLPERPPGSLRAAGQQMWVHLAGLPWFGASDAAAALILCKQADLADALRGAVREHGLTYESGGRRYANPALSALNQVEKQLASGLSLFGLTPADRARLGVGEVRPQSKFELLEMRRQEPGLVRN